MSLTRRQSLRRQMGWGGGGFGGFMGGSDPAAAKPVTTTPVTVKVTETQAIVGAAQTAQTTVTTASQEAPSSSWTTRSISTEVVLPNAATISTLSDSQSTFHASSSGSQTLLNHPSITMTAQTSTPPAAASAASSGANSQAVAGGVVAGIIVLAVIIFLLTRFYLRRKHKPTEVTQLFDPNRFKRSAALLPDSRPSTMVEFPNNPPPFPLPRGRRTYGDLKRDPRAGQPPAHNAEPPRDPFFDTLRQGQPLSPDSTAPPEIPPHLFSSAPSAYTITGGTSASGQVSTNSPSSAGHSEETVVQRPPNVFRESGLPPTPSDPPPYMCRDSLTPSYTRPVAPGAPPRKHSQGNAEVAPAAAP